MVRIALQVFHSILTKDGWTVTLKNRTVSRHRTQKESEMAATAAGRNAHAKGGLGQAVFHKADGSIREERTYGSGRNRPPEG